MSALLIYLPLIADSVLATLGSLEALTVSDPDDAVSGALFIPLTISMANIALDTWANNSDEMVSDSDSDYNLVTSP